MTHFENAFALLGETLGGLDSKALRFNVFAIRGMGILLLASIFGLLVTNHLQKLSYFLLVTELSMALVMIPIYFRTPYLIVSAPAIWWSPWTIHIRSDFHGNYTFHTIVLFENDLRAALNTLASQKIKHIQARSHVFCKNPQRWAKKFKHGTSNTNAAQVKSSLLEKINYKLMHLTPRNTEIVGVIDWHFD